MEIYIILDFYLISCVHKKKVYTEVITKHRQSNHV